MPVPPAQQITTGLGASARPANLALGARAVKLVRVDGDVGKDPAKLARVLQEVATVLRQTTQVAASNPVASSMLLRGLTSITGNFLVNHMLGRAYNGWAVVRPRGGFPQIYETLSQAGLDPTKQLQLHSIIAGITFDLLVY